MMESLIKKSGVLFFVGLIIMLFAFIIKQYYVYLFAVGFILVFYSLFIQDIAIKSRKYNINSIFNKIQKQRILNLIFLLIMVALLAGLVFYFKEGITASRIVISLLIIFFIFILVYNLRARFRLGDLAHIDSVINLVKSGVLSKEQAKYLLGIKSRIFLSKKEIKKIINKVKPQVSFKNKLALNNILVKLGGFFKKIPMLIFEFSKKFSKLTKKTKPKREVIEKAPTSRKFPFFAYLVSFFAIMVLLYIYLKNVKPIAIGFVLGLILILLFILVKSKLIKKSGGEEKIKNDKIISEIRHVLSNKAFKTELDTLLELLNKYNKITLTQISKGFNVDPAIAESWCKILAEANLAEIYYPAIGDTELRKIEAKEEGKNV